MIDLSGSFITRDGRRDEINTVPSGFVRRESCVQTIQAQPTVLEGLDYPFLIIFVFTLASPRNPSRIAWLPLRR